MGIIDEKKNIFVQLGALNSIKDGFEIPDSTNSLTSINNKKDITTFLLDMLTVLVGSEALKTATGEVMTGFVRNVEPTLSSSLKSQFIDFNSDLAVPSTFETSGYSVDAQTIDSYGTLKTDPSSDLGNLLYNDNSDDFNRKSYEAIQAAGTDVTFNNITINYNDTLDEFTYKPVTTGQDIGTFTNDYIDGLTIINEKEFISSTMNLLFGTVSNNQDKTKQQAILEDKINRTIQKIIDEEESIDIDDDELREIEGRAEERIEGIATLDVGCTTLDSTLTLDDLNTLITGTTASTDPLFVGDAYVDALINSFDPADEDQSEENQQAIKDGFFKRLINAIVNILVSAVTTTPQIRALISITSGFKNNDVPDIGDPVEDIKNKENLVNCLSESAKQTIFEYLFNLVKKELLKLIIPVSKTILKEKINQYIAIIRSLIGFI